MTKEEKIQEAYGEYFDKIKCVLDANGWILMTISITREISIEFERQVRVHENNTYGFPTMCVRPKSLQGIENNNGWIKIESENDLPTNTEVYHHGIMNGELICFKLQHPLNLKRLYKDFQKDNVTHYQPIIKPELPIY